MENNTHDTQNPENTQNTQNAQNNQSYSENGSSYGAQNSQAYPNYTNNNGGYYNQNNPNNSQYGPGYPGNASNYQSYNYNNQPYGPGYPNDIEKPVSLGDWLITLIVLAIPLVNLIMLFVWGFGSEVNESKRNFCKAQLIMIGIAFALSIVLFVIIGISAASAVSHYSSY